MRTPRCAQVTLRTQPKQEVVETDGEAQLVGRRCSLPAGSVPCMKKRRGPPAYGPRRQGGTSWWG